MSASEQASAHRANVNKHNENKTARVALPVPPPKVVKLALSHLCRQELKKTKTCPYFVGHALVLLVPRPGEFSVQLILLLSVFHLKPRLLIFVLKKTIQIYQQNLFTARRRHRRSCRLHFIFLFVFFRERMQRSGKVGRVSGASRKRATQCVTSHAGTGAAWAARGPAASARGVTIAPPRRPQKGDVYSPGSSRWAFRGPCCTPSGFRWP